MNTSKKITLFFFFIAVLVPVALFYLLENDFSPCKDIPATADSSETCWLIFNVTFVLIPIFIFSIIAYFLNEKTFIAWRKFTLWWILFSFILVLIAPSEDNFFGNIQELTLWISFFGYTLFATLLILYKSYKLRGK